MRRLRTAGSERDAAPPAVREQVDDADDVRKQQREEERARSPSRARSGRRASTKLGRPLRELEPLVERADELLGRAADRGEPRGVELPSRDR